MYHVITEKGLHKLRRRPKELDVVTETPELLRALGLVEWLFGLDESLAWFDRFVLTGFQVVKRQWGWVLIVKGYRNTKINTKSFLVTFIDGASVYDCLNNFARLARQGQIQWKLDKYAPDVGA